MKKITNLLIVCSLALTGAVMAQEPSPEQSPGKNKGPKKEAPADVKPKAERPPKTEAPKKESPAVAPKSEAPAVAPKSEAPAQKDTSIAESPAPTKPEKKAPTKPDKKAPAVTPEAKAPATSAEPPAPSAPPADKKQSRKDKKSPAASASTSPATSPATATTPTTPATAKTTPAPTTAPTTPATAAATTTPATAATTTPATAAATTTPAAAATASAAPSVAQTSPATSTTTATTKKIDVQKVQQIRQQHTSFRATARPERVPAVTFSASFRLPGVETWQGPQYEVYRSYRPERHDRGWYSSRYQRVELIAGGYYYFNNGYWYPAWGYDPGHEYYAYDAPIYVGKRSDPPDKVIADVQAALQEMGYYKGEVDGLIGPLTREALTGYQRDNGVTVTAVIDEPTLASLNMG